MKITDKQRLDFLSKTKNIPIYDSSDLAKKKGDCWYVYCGEWSPTLRRATDAAIRAEKSKGASDE